MANGECVPYFLRLSCVEIGDVVGLWAGARGDTLDYFAGHVKTDEYE